MEIKNKQLNETTCFAQTNFRNIQKRFGIKRDDRRRHMYLIGKTGMGKTTCMENMIISDINEGNGVCLVDPHGDFAEKLLNHIPKHRTNDVIYFNPGGILLFILSVCHTIYSRKLQTSPAVFEYFNPGGTFLFILNVCYAIYSRKLQISPAVFKYFNPGGTPLFILSV